MIPSFSFLGKTFAIYPVLALIGIFVSGIYACRTAKKRGYDDNDMIVFLLISGIGVLLGMHLLYGVTNLPLLQKLLHTPGVISSWKDFLDVVVSIFGGSVFYGGLLGGIAAGYLYGKNRKLDLSAYDRAGGSALPCFRADRLLFGRMLLRGRKPGRLCLSVQSHSGGKRRRALSHSACGSVLESAFVPCPVSSAAEKPVFRTPVLRISARLCASAVFAGILAGRHAARKLAGAFHLAVGQPPGNRRRAAGSFPPNGAAVCAFSGSCGIRRHRNADAQFRKTSRIDAFSNSAWI